MATGKKIYYVAEGQQEELAEANFAIYTDNQQTTTAYDEAGEAICPSCGELLAWHEAACGLVAAPQPAEAAGEVVLVAAPPSTFAHSLGHRVQPAPQAPAYTIIWRGQMKERHPGTGLVQRVNVYRLDDGYWDCYREEELQAA